MGQTGAWLRGEVPSISTRFVEPIVSLDSYRTYFRLHDVRERIADMGNRDIFALAELSSDAAELEVLAAHPNDAVRRRAAENPATPQRVLGFLVADPVPTVRLEAGLRVEDSDLAATLADDPDYQLRFALARRSNNPWLLACLATDSLYDVRDELVERFELTAESSSADALRRFNTALVSFRLSDELVATARIYRKGLKALAAQS